MGEEKIILYWNTIFGGNFISRLGIFECIWMFLDAFGCFLRLFFF